MQAMRTEGVAAVAPGGDEISQLSDSRSGMDGYVHLCLFDQSPMEYRAREAGREMIARDVWKEPHGTTLTNVIDVYINYVRKKIEQPGKRQLIHTVRGVGYAMRDSS